jgi:hypothetical protein
MLHTHPHIHGALVMRMNRQSQTTFILRNRLPEIESTGNKTLESFGLPSEDFLRNEF